MPDVLVTKKIQGDINATYELVSNMTNYPTFMPDLVSVELLERDGNSTVTNWVSSVAGRRIQWTERDVFFPEQYRIEYEQIKGDLKVFRGYWQLTQEEDGVMVALYVDFEFGIPMIAGMLNPLLKKTVRDNSENMLKYIEKELKAKG